MVELLDGKCRTCDGVRMLSSGWDLDMLSVMLFGVRMGVLYTVGAMYVWEGV